MAESSNGRSRYDGLLPARNLSQPAEQFERDYGESLLQVADLEQWNVGNDLSHEYERIESEVREAVQRETDVQKVIRDKVFPVLKARSERRCTRLATATIDDLAAVHRGLLFNGGVEACDGSLKVHATVPLTICQIGVSMVSYEGQRGVWRQRLFRRDLRQRIEDPAEEAIALLEGRGRGSLESEGGGELIRQTLRQHAERAILLDRSDAIWRMGHGNPVTYELLTGAGVVELMEVCHNTLRRLVEDFQRFVFIAGQPRDQLLLTIGSALRPYEFAVVETLDDELDRWLHQKRFAVDGGAMLAWGPELLAAPEWIPRFIKEVASRIVVGVFRAAEGAPPLVFYAHEDHADVAAHIAIADGMLQGPHGFPLLLQLARHVGKAVFGQGIDELAESAYAAAGAPWRYRYA